MKCAWQCLNNSDCGSSVYIIANIHLKTHTHWAWCACHRQSHCSITGSIPKITRRINNYQYLVIISSSWIAAWMGCTANLAWLLIHFECPCVLLIPVYRWGHISIDDQGWRADLSGWGSRCSPPHSHTARQAGWWSSPGSGRGQRKPWLQSNISQIIV